VRGGFRNLRLDILPLSERAPQLLANGAVDLVLAEQSLDVGVPPNDCLYQDQFVCISCQKMDPVGDVLSLQDFTERDDVVVWYF
jgi:LysR family nod box-dependent transcriptional activator